MKMIHTGQNSPTLKVVTHLPIHLMDIFNEAKEALCAYCSALVGEGKVLPMPSDISLIERGNEGDVLAVVEAANSR